MAFTGRRGGKIHCEEPRPTPTEARDDEAWREIAQRFVADADWEGRRWDGGDISAVFINQGESCSRRAPHFGEGKKDLPATQRYWEGIFEPLADSFDSAS